MSEENIENKEKKCCCSSGVKEEKKQEPCCGGGIVRETESCCRPAQKQASCCGASRESKGSVLGYWPLIISAAAVILSMTGLLKNILPFDIAWVAILISGVPLIKHALETLFKKRTIKASFLVSTAIIAAVYIGEYLAAGEVAVIMALGGMLEGRTSRKAKAEIENLLNKNPKTARLLINGQEKIVPVDDIKEGDTLRVLAGETIPVDGIILEGSISVDESIITGESLPKDKGEGENVYSGSINHMSVFTMRAVKDNKNSSLQRIIDLLAKANEKAPIETVMDKWATYIVVAALFFAIATYFVTGEMIRAVSILVVFCPCALVLATPTAIMAALGNATKHGILIRAGKSLEALTKITMTAFDKTGTITTGKPAVAAVHIMGGKKEAEFIALAASVEALSEHPLGKTIVEYAKEKNIAYSTPEDFTLIAGRGIRAKVNGQELFAGNIKLLQESGAILSEAMIKQGEILADKGQTVIYIASKDEAIGLIGLADSIKSKAVSTVRALENRGLKVVMLTGDNERAADYISSQAGIKEVYSGLLPQDKMDLVKSFKGDQTVCMVGDGVNDAPSIKSADIGIAMGAGGSDISINQADIVLMNDKIENIYKVFYLADKTTKKIKHNIILSMSVNFVAIALAATGWLGPVLGAIVHNASSIVVIISSMTLFNLKYKEI
ncbi:copper-(or silver)-translocating P-type ATPase [Parelusimicrobium proximum]|uniref:heavy metal translocating P-type ATPase n=1 Tax=Parelusimicrobium proximum TaxID=3228953 RepID=UPI003D179461